MTQTNRSRFAALSLPLFLFCICSRPATAQSVAALNGTVRDTSGAVITDAKVMLTNVNTGVSQSVHSNTSGAYSFVNVLPGRYVLEASRDGFKTDRLPEFSLEVNQTATINFSLQVGATEE